VKTIVRFLAALVAGLGALAYAMGETLNAALTRYMARTGALLSVVYVPNGSIVAIAASYGAEKEITALSNANPAVATLEASHGIIVGDAVELTSGWGLLNNKIVRASVVSTNDVSLEGQNTTSTIRFPAGTGIGSLREILTWTELQQILDVTSSGGEQQFLTYQFLADDFERRIPTNKAASGLAFRIADDETLAGYQLVAEANQDRLQRAVRITLPSGRKLFYNAVLSVNETPSLTVNEIASVEVTLSLQAPVQRYAD
jgi:hypothetical protein